MRADVIACGSDEIVNIRANPILMSYAKTLVACLAVFGVALSLAGAGAYWLPAGIGFVAVLICVLAALAALTLVCASAVVILRYRRAQRGERDLFLELNRSREPAAIETAAPTHISRMRRWLAQHVLGHDFVVGDLVEIKTLDEIRTTINEQGCLEELPFMPEMLAMCGRRAYVYRCIHRLFDYRKSRRMRHMDGAVLLAGALCNGSSHGGCQAACQTIWKPAWLRRVDQNVDTSAVSRPSNDPNQADTAVLQFSTHAPRFICQLTQLHAASRPIGKWSPINFFRPLIAGNVTPAVFVIGWLTHLFNELQHYRQGVGFPAFEVPERDVEASARTRLQAGDRVIVRSSAEVRATLSDQLLHRGLWFDPDMLKHCGHRYCVQAEIKSLIDIVTGEMRTMKTPAYILRDVTFSGERQLFNAQHEPLFWRDAWLRRDGD